MYEGGALMTWISALSLETPESCLTLVPHEDGREAPGCEPGRERSLDTQSASVLISAFQPPVSNKFPLFISCPDGGILLQQPEQTKTPANWSALTCQSPQPWAGPETAGAQPGVCCFSSNGVGAQGADSARSVDGPQSMLVAFC